MRVMKKISVVSLLTCLCFVMLGVAGASLIPTLKGQVVLGQYQGIEMEASSAQVTDEEVELALEELLWSYATTEKVTRDAALADTLTVDYRGVMNGKEQDDFTDTDREITLGEDQFIVQGMDEHLLGADVNQPVTVTLTVPETHHVSEYIGEQVTFTVTVKEILRPVKPELTDEFVKTLGEYTSVSDFKTKFKQQYRQQAADSEQATRHNFLFQTAVENAEVLHYPALRVGELAEEWHQTLALGAEDMGMSVEDYASFAYGLQTEKERDEAALESAQSIAKQEMVLDAIAGKEGIKVTDELYSQYYADYLEAFTAEGYTEEYMVEYYGGKEGLSQQFLMELVAVRLEELAVAKQ